MPPSHPGLEFQPPSDTITPHQIILGDDREEITNVNDSQYSAVVFLKITTSSGRTEYASGAFIADNLILTAGHVVYNIADDEWVNSITIYPGGIRSSLDTIEAGRIWTFREFINGFSPEYDCGLILVEDDSSEYYFGVDPLNNFEIQGQDIWHYAYHGDLTPRGSIYWGPGEMRNPDDSSKVILHTADSTKGSSGGAIVRQTDYLNIVGINIGEMDNNDYLNAANRITDDIFNLIDAALDEGL